jgi:hypothetical protein
MAIAKATAPSMRHTVRSLSSFRLPHRVRRGDGIAHGPSFPTRKLICSTRWHSLCRLRLDRNVGQLSGNVRQEIGA